MARVVDHKPVKPTIGLKHGQGMVDHKPVKLLSNFIAGRPKVALLFLVSSLLFFICCSLLCLSLIYCL